ncbi:hypothetical protein QBC47DRAFT_109968 [Echria macrotheca]|uniref:Uncharacterized protein n=1 Tax=Echria macrotheca TaxID=438768 RepID=A0AAJ0BJV9_9PEZI|nr:hypothetical protein QBC47DRAFT_109968 [Echria macrotheca]
MYLGSSSLHVFQRRPLDRSPMGDTTRQRPQSSFLSACRRCLPGPSRTIRRCDCLLAASQCRHVHRNLETHVPHRLPQHGKSAKSNLPAARRLPKSPVLQPSPYRSDLEVPEGGGGLHLATGKLDGWNGLVYVRAGWREILASVTAVSVTSSSLQRTSCRPRFASSPRRVIIARRIWPIREQDPLSKMPMRLLKTVYYVKRRYQMTATTTTLGSPMSSSSLKIRAPTTHRFLRAKVARAVRQAPYSAPHLA